MQHKPIQLAILDTQSIFRTALKTYLSYQIDINVVVQAATINEFFQKSKDISLDVLLVDLFVPGLNGYDAVTTIRNHNRDIKILVLSTNMDIDLISDLLDCGIHGYISKDDEPEDLLRAIRVVSDGNIYKNRVLTDAFYRNSQNVLRIKSQETFVMLNEREKKLLRLIWDEKSNKQIADELLLGIRSVEKLRQELKEKLNTRSTIGMLKYALRTKIVKDHYLQTPSEPKVARVANGMH